MNKGGDVIDGRVLPVLLSGGGGSRLWPVSNQDCPKQFLNLNQGAGTLLQQTAQRFHDMSQYHTPMVLTAHHHRFRVAEQLHNLQGMTCMITEPCMRNTAPAMLTAALHAYEQIGASVPMLFVPSDHFIKDETAFHAAVQLARKTLQPDAVTVFGVTPEYAETGYGYIHCPQASEQAASVVHAFTEKPALQDAQRYLASGEYYWNSGLFMATAGCIVQLMERYHPQMLALCYKALMHAERDSDFVRLQPEAYERCEAVSFDCAVMERTNNTQMVKLASGWADMGSWESLWRASPKNEAGNVMNGNAFAEETHDSYIYNEDQRPVAVLGQTHVGVIATQEAVLVTSLAHAQQVKNVADAVKQQAKTFASSRRVEKPWGYFELLHTGDQHQVKRLHLNPGGMISLQVHHHRSEHWVVVQGQAEVTCDGVIKQLKANESIDIPIGCKHRLANRTEDILEVIEVQSGAYLGEDDIIRLEDSYGRKRKVA